MQPSPADITAPLAFPASRTRTRDRRPARLGDYDVIGLLARGGMSSVYLGAHAVTGERVALKVLDAHWINHIEIVERMFGEHEVASRARHHGLLEIRDARRSTDGVPFLVMELLDGENLGDLVDRGRVVIAAIAAIGGQIANALCALHAAGYVHCDIKPDNVFLLYAEGLAGWPRVKVVDYGVSRRLGEVAAEGVAGTPSCMAPEQWYGHATEKSDVYSLGCLLYWLVTGAPPFSGSLPQIMTAHVHQLADRVSAHRRGVPIELDNLIGRALAKDAAMRPTMRDMARELVALATTRPAMTELVEVEQVEQVG